MAKELMNIGGGKLIISEEGGNFSIALDAAANLGGGEAAGVISGEGAGKLVLHGKMAFDLGMKLIEAHSPPALVPVEEAAKAIADGVIGGM